MNRLIRFGRWAIAFALAGAAAHAQFQEIKPAPFSPAVARQKIRALLENTDAGNRDRTVGTISDWLKWYRDILDDELIARWKSDGRSNVPLLMTPLADARLAREVVEYSWRVDRPAAFRVEYAPMFEDLMARYPESAKPFLDDLLAPALPSQPALNLSQAEAEAACRILLDMPDIGAWRKNALQILPRYRPVADQLLRQDLGSPDQERVYRAQRWRTDLRLDLADCQRCPPAGYPYQPQGSEYSGGAGSRFAAASHSWPDAEPGVGLHGADVGHAGIDRRPDSAERRVCFFEYSAREVTARLRYEALGSATGPGEGQTQTLVLHNKGKGPQKRCVVHWTLVQ